MIQGGLAYIFGSSVIAQVCRLVSSIVVIRHLPKEEYGLFAGADNIYSYLSVFVGLGLVNSVLQFCSEKRTEEFKNGVYWYALTRGAVFNIGVSIVVFGLALYNESRGDRQISNYLHLMCGYPFTAFFLNFSQTALRVRQKNREYAYTNILLSVLTVLGNITFTCVWGISGLICSKYVADVGALAFSGWQLKKDDFFKRVTSRVRLPHNDKKSILSYGAVGAVTNFTSSMLVLLDVSCLNLVLSSSEVLADYKVAATIPSAMVFVPSCLITYGFPQIVSSFSEGTSAFLKKVKEQTKIFAVLAFVIALGLFLFAPVIIYVLYGEKYLNVVPIFRVLSLNFFVYAGFRYLFGNVIAAMRKPKINLLHTIAAGILNVVLNVVLIQRYGSIGAAVATTCVTVFVLMLEIAYLYWYFKK